MYILAYKRSHCFTKINRPLVKVTLAHFGSHVKAIGLHAAKDLNYLAFQSFHYERIRVTEAIMCCEF